MYNQIRVIVTLEVFVGVRVLYQDPSTADMNIQCFRVRSRCMTFQINLCTVELIEDLTTALIRQLMSNESALASEESDASEKTQQASTVLKGAKSRINRFMERNVLLLWLDSNIDENTDQCNTINQLRRISNNAYKFDDQDKCVDFLVKNHNRQVLMVISETFCRETVPMIHNVTQLHGIFIICENKMEHEQWAEQYFKIKGVYTEMSPICEAIQQTAYQYEQNDMSMSFISTTGAISTSESDKLDCSFMYTEILKETLLAIEFKEEHINQFTDYCLEKIAKDEHDINSISKLGSEYRNETPIHWYTSDWFVYSTINQALRLMDVNLIMKMGFFLCDLHREITRLHSQQFDKDYSSKGFTLYRGQCLSKADFDCLQNTKGGLIAFNSFLSTGWSISYFTGVKIEYLLRRSTKQAALFFV